MKMITKPLHSHTHKHILALRWSVGWVRFEPGEFEYERGLLLTYPNHTSFPNAVACGSSPLDKMNSRRRQIHTHIAEREKKEEKNGFARTFVFYFTQVQCTARYMYDLFVGTAPSRTIIPCTTFSNVLGGEALFLLSGWTGGGGEKSTLFSAQNMVRNACFCHGVSMINESHFLFTTSPPRVGPVRVAGTSWLGFICAFLYTF